MPRLEVGARHDGGEAETGAGMELGGGIAWSGPTLGLSLDLSGRALVAHGDDDLEDRGFAASVVFDPDPATQRGPSLTLRQDWGGASRGGLDALFASDPLSDRAGSEEEARWTAEAAWGFAAFGGRFTASPHAGVGLAAGARDYTLGWRLAPAVRAGAPNLSLGLEATRRETATAAPEHAAGFEVRMSWQGARRLRQRGRRRPTPPSARAASRFRRRPRIHSRRNGHQSFDAVGHALGKPAELLHGPVRGVALGYGDEGVNRQSGALARSLQI